jgi:hypothetical protein
MGKGMEGSGSGIIYVGSLSRKLPGRNEDKYKVP